LWLIGFYLLKAICFPSLTIIIFPIDDALSTLYAAVEARSKNLKLRSTVASTITSVTARNGVGAIYMLNNFTYIRRELLESAVLDIYGDQLAEQLNKRVRTCKVRYLEIWSPLISALMDAGAEDGKFGLGAVKSALPGQHAGAERRDVKDRLGRFNDAFEEVMLLHQAANIASNDPDLKDQLRNEIERMIMPTCLFLLPLARFFLYLQVSGFLL
jgi:exocyst complex protein 7